MAIEVLVVHPANYGSVTFTSTRCLHLRKEVPSLLLLYMPRQWYSVNDHRKTFMINYNERDLHYPGMEPRLIDSQGNVIQIEAVFVMIVGILLFFRPSLKNYLFAVTLLTHLRSPPFPKVFSPFLLYLYQLKKIYRLS